jgi:hypothetical protein
LRPEARDEITVTEEELAAMQRMGGLLELMEDSQSADLDYVVSEGSTTSASVERQRAPRQMHCPQRRHPGYLKRSEFGHSGGE